MIDAACTATMTASHSHDDAASAGDPRHGELRSQWRASYGQLVAEQLNADRRYSLVRAGAVEYAFTNYESYVRALHHIWRAGLVPESLRSVRGDALLDVAPNLQAVDPDLADLRRSDVERRSRFAKP
jgi:hypothetical protein